MKPIDGNRNFIIAKANSKKCILKEHATIQSNVDCDFGGARVISNKMRENIKVNHGRNQNKEGKRAIAQ